MSSIRHPVVIDPGHDAQMNRFDELLSPQDLAGYLDIPVKTVYGWRHRGLGPTGFRVGRHLRYRRGDVEEWISTQLELTGGATLKGETGRYPDGTR